MGKDSVDMCDDKQVEYRLTQVEGEVQEVKTDIRTMMRKHLPHISSDIKDVNINVTEKITDLDLKTTKQIANLQARMTWIGGGMGAGIIIAIIIQFLT